MGPMNFLRRDFLRQAGVGLWSLPIVSKVLAETNSEIPKRKLGKTGLEVTMLALGGHHIGRIKSDSESIVLLILR